MSKPAQKRAPVVAISAPVEGALWMIAASTCWALMSAMIRYLATDLPPVEVAFFRILFAAFIMVPHMVRNRTGIFPRTHRGLYLVRAALHAGAMLCWFSALTMMPLAPATALYFTAPFFATILAVLFLGEVVRTRRWIAVAAGFAGAMLILRPGLEAPEWGAILVLGTAITSAIGRITVRTLTRDQSPNDMVAYNFTILTPVLLVPAILVWQWPTLEMLAWLAALGIVGAVSHLFMTRAYVVAEASQIAPFDFTQLIVVAFIGYLIFGEIPDEWTIAGSVLIAAAAIYIAQREAAARKAKRVAT
jgi:drug/metabolite transporter (DMT)-like permease